MSCTRRGSSRTAPFFMYGMGSISVGHVLACLFRDNHFGFLICEERKDEAIPCRYDMYANIMNHLNFVFLYRWSRSILGMTDS